MRSNLCHIWEKKKAILKNRHYLLLKLVKYELYDDIILEPQNLCHPLSNPRFDDFQIHFGHVHLRAEQAPNDTQLNMSCYSVQRAAGFTVSTTNNYSDQHNTARTFFKLNIYSGRN